MNVRFWGTRGSTPSPGARTARCGGNTSCVEVVLSDGTLLILDAGSGIRELGDAVDARQAVLLLSHYHWDHIQGFPFFAPIYADDASITVIGPEFDGRGPYEMLGAQSSLPYFPATGAQWRGLASCSVTPATEIRLGSAVIRAARLSHPGPTLGYRIEDQGQVFVYMSDDEVELASPQCLASMVDLAQGADVLVHDCQYSEHEYLERRGWGHSTPRQALSMARAADVACLYLFHHDPSHSDEEVEALACEARRLADGLDVAIAREGDTFCVPDQSFSGPRSDEADDGARP